MLQPIAHQSVNKHPCRSIESSLAGKKVLQQRHITRLRAALHVWPDNNRVQRPFPTTRRVRVTGCASTPRIELAAAAGLSAEREGERCAAAQGSRRAALVATRRHIRLRAGRSRVPSMMMPAALAHPRPPEPEPEPEQPPFQPEALVQVRGLVSEARHNGQRAQVKRFNNARQRWEVRLVDHSPAVSISVRTENLTACSRYQDGDEVEVRGLVGQTQHNGRRGVVRGAMRGDRYQIELQAGLAGRPIGVRPGNLVLRRSRAARQPRAPPPEAEPP